MLQIISLILNALLTSGISIQNLQMAIRQIAACPHRENCPVVEKLDEMEEKHRIRETHCRASLAQYDSLRIIDHSVTHDTIAILRTETLWREPDTLGNIYPLMTVNEERAAWRETDYNIQTTRIDTIYLTTDTTTQQSAKTQTKIRAPDSTIGWIVAAAITLTVVLIITIAAAIAIKSLRI